MDYANALNLLQQALVSMPGGRPAPAAPSYYGPIHQQLADYFNAGSNWRSQFPRYVNQLMFEPELRNMHGGFNMQAYAPQPAGGRIDWFPKAAEQAAAPAPAEPVNAGGLLQAWNSTGPAPLVQGGAGADVSANNLMQG